ncbi:unnamed protein product [marine sediment metagenome]|uniref:Uncharacterized protein n=1 Tax=marine sediment metagenome TaxID=412755 RepID=X1LCI0_9ZZZZ
MVLEPIQGWGGSVVYPDDYLPKIRKMCDKLGILMIVDEVLTCCARTGKMFCVENYDVVPDIMTLKRVIQNEVQNVLAIKLLNGEIKEGDTVSIDVTGPEGRVLEFRV